MDWTAGYAPTWRLYRVNKDTFADAGRVGRVDSARVERVRGNLLESGTLTATQDVGAAFEEGYYRLVMVAEQNGHERVEVATFFCSSAGGGVDKGAEVIDIEGRSVLYPASVRKLLAGTYAPMGADGAAYVGKMLRECIAAPVSVDGSFTLNSHVVFDLGESYLDAAWQVLGAGNFVMQIDGHGTVHVLPMPTDAALSLDSTNAALLMPSVRYDLDYSNVPNVYIADDDGMTAKAVNDDAASATSTIARGYEHTYIDSSPTPVNGETLAAYARRRLAELSVVEDTRRYTREFYPGVMPYSIVKGTLPDARLFGEFRVSAQSLEMGAGITVTETAVEEVRTWTA